MKIINLILILVIVLVFAKCEDPVVGDYIPNNIVEGFLFVGEPINNIILMRSQPIDGEFYYDKALIRDAKVIIKAEDNEFELKIDAEGEMGYYYKDQSYVVKPSTKYDLDITLSDGSKINGTCTTPPVLNFKVPLKRYYQFPFDTINAPPTDTLFWNKLTGFDYYLIGVKCVDTLEYGMYLENPTNEKNRRIERSFRSNDFFKDQKAWAFVPNDKSPVVWSIFKWFGRQEISVIAPDYNMLRWFLQNRTSREYNSLLTSVEGNGIGVFGSGSIAKDTVMLLKNQP